MVQNIRGEITMTVELGRVIGELNLWLEEELDKHFTTDSNSEVIDHLQSAIHILKAAQESGLTEDRIIKLLKSDILNELWKLSGDLGHGELMAVIRKLERG